jgi:hypothetical protein
LPLYWVKKGRPFLGFSKINCFMFIFWKILVIKMFFFWIL